MIRANSDNKNCFKACSAEDVSSGKCSCVFRAKEIKNNLYTYKNKQYKVLHDDLEVKDSNSREWKRGVLYEQLETGLLFVRSWEEFVERFEKS